MANQWLRLWHDMPTDPKWRTIAKASGQRIGDVMAVYCHLLVCASNATERGRTQSFCSEDVASSLDMETEQVQRIIEAMQGRVLESDALMGWEKRQVAREDGAAERAKAWREAQKLAKEHELNATERNRTQSERKQTPDKTREDKKVNTTPPPDGVDITVWQDFLKLRKAKRAPMTDTALDGIRKEADKAGLSLGDALAMCCKRGWQGFESDWIGSHSPTGQIPGLM
jgi:hypothetical protein